MSCPGPTAGAFSFMHFGFQYLLLIFKMKQIPKNGIKDIFENKNYHLTIVTDWFSIIKFSGTLLA